MKDNFIFYKSFYEAIKKIKNKELKADIFEAICELGLYDNDIELNDEVGQMIMTLITPVIKANTQRYENGKKGGRPNKKTSGLEEIKTSGLENKKPNKEVRSKKIEEDIKENSKRKKSFTKPYIEEIELYCKDRNNNVNASNFYNFYESKDWMIGKNKMKDWKACVRTWEQRDKKKSVDPEWFNKKISKEESTKEDIKELERLLEEFK